MVKQSSSNPIIPGNVKDRTGTAGILRRANAEIKKRYAGLSREVLEIFDRIPVFALNDAADRVLYGMTPEQMAVLSAELQAAVERWIASGRDPAYSFWWNQYASEASHLGTAQSVANLTNLSATYAAARSIETVIYSQPYQTRLGMAQIKSYEHWTGLAASQKAELAQIIGRAVVDGKNPKAVRTEIMERLEVSRSKAAQYAQTDITDTLRQARWAESEYTSETLGIKIGMLWTSALLPTTRAWHASKNGKVLTTEEVRAFYSVNGNRYNCYLPGTRVAGRFVAGAKSRYKGPAVRLVTASGRELAVTANHPVMTSRGLVAAAEVSKGDNLIAYLGQQEDPTGVVNLNGELVSSRIEDVFSALVDSGHQRLARVCGVDFHGDAAFMQPDIEVVDAERVLPVAMNPALAQLLDDLSFVHPDSSAAARRALEPLSNRHIAVSSGGVRGCNVSTPLIGGDVDGLGALGLTHISGGQPGVMDGAGDGFASNSKTFAHRENGFSRHVSGVKFSGAQGMTGPSPFIPAEPGLVEGLHQSSITDAEAVRNVLEAFTGLASFDEVVDVVRSEYDGHVFDLQELSGLMLGSGIVASNCHCSQTEALLDADGKPILTKKLQSTLSNELSAWKKNYAK
ncbi:phage minor head protein [Rhodoferax sp. TH121]|uniref:phage minor head protein n=1 Tax=Rhodoferax sp. TH121 TaxID=2022803 RepID=UPI001C3E2853|nr:phage minor head protein [Rhodoferax sp. TH121]